MKKLDLHNTRHEFAGALVENFVLLTPAPLKIITGNSHRMKEITTTVLDQHDIEYDSQPHEGWIIVRKND